MKKISLAVCILVLVLVVYSVSKFNRLAVLEENVGAAFSEITNQYQRRFDLVPNLVSTVQGAIKHERAVLKDVVDARSRVGTIQLNASDLSDQQAIAAYQEAQAALGSSLSRLIAVTENYPELKSNALFQDLMAQLEGTENRISVARGRYIDSIKEYNSQIRQFPTRIFAERAGFLPKQNFSVDNLSQISTAPVINLE